MGNFFDIEYVVFDMNGTISVDGEIPEDVATLLQELAKHVEVYIITSDTFGTAEKLALKGVEVIVLDPTLSASVQKKEWIEKLGADNTVAVGNGYNDHLMLERAALGIAVCWKEGASLTALEMADIVVTSPVDAINLLLNPVKIKATLRD